MRVIGRYRTSVCGNGLLAGMGGEEGEPRGGGPNDFLAGGPEI